MRSAAPGTGSRVGTEPALIALLAAIGLYLALPGKLTIGPSWLFPSLEGVAFLGLLATSPIFSRTEHPRRTALSRVLLGLVTAVNLASVFLLARGLVQGTHVKGGPLLLGGLALWLTQILLFAVWYWEIDGDEGTQLLFPQAQSDPRTAWRPRFYDYLYVSVTNATAFSPTDTLPLTGRAKALMGLQSLGSLTTLALVVARAVNIIH